MADNLVQIEPTKDLTTEHSTNLRDHFPFAEVRGMQSQALEAIGKWLSGPKKFFILEAPTGTGKSPLGIAVASYAKTLPGFGKFQQGAYYLSPQKSLTAQLVGDFASMGLVELKGRANFQCDKWTQNIGSPVDCEVGASLNESSSVETARCSNCPYRAAKDNFIANPFGTTNFSYYLNETSHAGELPNRNVLILDEAHNTEDQVLSLTDTTINKRRCEEYGVVGRLPIFDAGDNEAVLTWLDSVFVPAAIAHGNALAKKFKEARDEERAKAAKKMHALDRFLQRINMFRNSADPGEWFVWSDWDAERRTGSGDLMIKPLTARLFADDMLFSKAQKVLIMSATILDFRTFMRNLGISPTDAETLALDSEFPVENRPIFYKPVGNMAYRYKKETLPKMGVILARILRKHATEKGIVHTHSFENNRYFVEYLNTEFEFRIITHDNSKGSRDRTVIEHFSNQKPTVLFSPSCDEGLDLKDDLGRFNVVTKIPYKQLNPYVKVRMKRDPDWYTMHAVLSLVQATGRTVRHKTDKSDQYILDSGFRDLVIRASRMFPKWWMDSVKWLE